MTGKQTSLLVYLKDLTQEEAITEAKKRRGRILTNRELDGLIQQGILNLGIFPLWTGTQVEYSGTACKITENGKTSKAKIPEKDGWYEQDKFGLPFGKPLSDGNPEARYLWRRSENSGLVARYYVRWLDGLRRYVDCYDWPGYRLGVLILQSEKS